MKKQHLFILFIMGMILLLTACSQGGALSVRDAWARPGIDGGNSAIFFTIENNTGSDEKLLSASSDVAASVELHKTTMEDGVMKMTPQEFVAIPAGEDVIFQPGDLHVMLIDLQGDLAVGDDFSVVLTFENAGEISFNVTVQEP